MNTALLLGAGGLIIVALGGYAAHLLIRLRRQKKLLSQQQALAMGKRNANIFENVDLLCQAGIQGQCDLSEISIRVCGMLEYVQGDERIDTAADYPALYELYQTVNEMARGEARQALEKQERMRQNLTRQKAEARLGEAINEELKALRERVRPLNDQILVTQVG